MVSGGARCHARDLRTQAATLTMNRDHGLIWSSLSSMRVLRTNSRGKSASTSNIANTRRELSLRYSPKYQVAWSDSKMPGKHPSLSVKLKLRRKPCHAKSRKIKVLYHTLCTICTILYCTVLYRGIVSPSSLATSFEVLKFEPEYSVGSQNRSSLLSEL